ncbi:MAG TPA: serine/threonine protein kinase, partial [Polyangiaceae bacterium]|nr:serine/threonine protein kinase [Polyangiaceae bacterium]
MALASEEPSSPETLYELDRVAEPQLQEMQLPDNHKAGDLVDDKYELLELLGSGGMSHVWRARDYVLNIDVALKII